MLDPAELALLEPSFRRRLLRLDEACPFDLWVKDGFRSRAEQQYLYDGYKAGLPGFNPANRPGTSRHEDLDSAGKPAATAVDLRYGPGARAWVHEHAHRYGLRFPYPHEPWHIEPDGTPDPIDDEDLDMTPEQLRTIVRDEVDAALAIAIRGSKNHPYHLAAILRVVVAIAKKVGAPLPDGVK